MTKPNVVASQKNSMRIEIKSAPLWTPIYKAILNLPSSQLDFYNTSDEIRSTPGILTTKNEGGNQTRSLSLTLATLEQLNCSYDVSWLRPQYLSWLSLSCLIETENRTRARGVEMRLFLLWEILIIINIPMRFPPPNLNFKRLHLLPL